MILYPRRVLHPPPIIKDRDYLPTAGAASSPIIKDHDSLPTAGAASLPIIKDRDYLPTAGAAFSPIIKDRDYLPMAGAASLAIINHVKVPTVKNVIYARRVLHPRRQAARPSKLNLQQVLFVLTSSTTRSQSALRKDSLQVHSTNAVTLFSIFSFGIVVPLC